MADAHIQRRKSKRLDAPRTYEDVPVIHRPHWKWLVIWYFFIGGISAASGMIGAIASLSGKARHRDLARHAYWVSLLTIIACPILLILDLGKPSRFFNMLRVIKLRSPMSVGSWALTLFGVLVGLAVLKDITLGETEDSPSSRAIVRRLPTRPIHVAILPLGAMVAAYTGALIGATAVPVWAKAPRLLTALFVSSAFTTGTSAIAMSRVATGHGRTPSPALGGLKQLSMLVELVLLFGWLRALGRSGRPLRTGTVGTVVDQGVIGVGLAAPMVIAAVAGYRPGRGAQALRLVGLAASLAGGFALRYAVVIAGRDSADDPQATFEFTKAPED